ncbi:MAG: crossover junction endodeoxyribonuclease RuvC [bacterium]|nr:crossover junction endodeoxyribonuclease RuvC [bacterium]
MIILGIDPGTRRIGYGIIEKERSKLKMLAAGILKISAGGPLRQSSSEASGSASRGKRRADDFGALQETKKQVEGLIKKFKPEVLAIEKLYFVKNQKTGLEVAEARGAIILSALENNLAVKEYGPNEIKAGVAGYGLADKRAILKMVGLILGTPDLRLIDDASDALAVAIMAAQSSKIQPF